MGQLAGLEIEEHEAFEEVVVEDQIQVEILRLGADALLPRHEGEAFAQLQEKGLEIADQCVFELRLEQPSGGGHAEEFEEHGIVDEIPRPQRQRSQFLGGLVAYRLAILAGQEAFLVKGADLPIERAGAPALIGGLVHVPLAGCSVVDPNQQTVMGPAQF